MFYRILTKQFKLRTNGSEEAKPILDLTGGDQCPISIVITLELVKKYKKWAEFFLFIFY